MSFEVGLFVYEEEGLKLLGHSRDPEIVELVRERIVAEQQKRLGGLMTPPVKVSKADQVADLLHITDKRRDQSQTAGEK